MRQETLLQSNPETWAEAAEDEDHGPVLLRLAAKPMRRLDAGELLYILQHNLSLPLVAPLALDKLEGQPFLQAATYPGDLLIALMEADESFWREHRALWEQVILLLGAALQEMEQTREAQELGDYYPEFTGENLMAAALHFKSIHA